MKVLPCCDRPKKHDLSPQPRPDIPRLALHLPKPRHRNSTISGIEPPDHYALCIAPLHPDTTHRDSDDVSVLAGDKEFIILINGFNRYRKVDLIINTPGAGQGRRDGYEIGRAAVNFGVPYITTIRGSRLWQGMLSRLLPGRMEL